MQRFVNRPVRTRTQGGVGAGGANSPATRFEQARPGWQRLLYRKLIGNASGILKRCPERRLQAALALGFQAMPCADIVMVLLVSFVANGPAPGHRPDGTRWRARVAGSATVQSPPGNPEYSHRRIAAGTAERRPLGRGLRDQPDP